MNFQNNTHKLKMIDYLNFLKKKQKDKENLIKPFNKMKFKCKPNKNYYKKTIN